MYLIQGHKVLPATLDGIKSCICTTIKLATGRDYTQSVELSSILSKYHLECPRERFEVPDWNLVLVLNALLKEPFEPLKSVSVKYLTYKTVFLVAMAMAARISEVNAIDFRKIMHDSHWHNVWLEPNSLFLAKTQKSRKPTAARQFKLTNLAQFVGSKEKEVLLCPVRALRIYIKRTAHLRKHKKCLFLSLQPNRKTEITRQSINIWIRNTIRLAYHLAGEDDANLGRATNHEIRSITSSLSFERSLSLENVMKSCHWKGHNTFTSYYLKDVTVLSAELMRFSPLVVASTVINKVLLLLYVLVITFLFSFEQCQVSLSLIHKHL